MRFLREGGGHRENYESRLLFREFGPFPSEYLINFTLLAFACHVSSGVAGAFLTEVVAEVSALFPQIWPFPPPEAKPPRP